MNSRRKQMAKWAVEKLPTWPNHESLADADPSEIGCEFFHHPSMSSLPVLKCKLGGGFISSSDYFYAKRGVVKT